MSSPRWLIATLLAVGIALRIWQYVGDTSLWFDELSIARNIQERSFVQLMTEPLGYNQIAPLGFLAMVKGSALLIGPSDRALRLFPFLCGLLSLILFWRVAVRALDPIAATIAMGLFALGLPFILYSTTLKQYGSDITATLALTAIALDLRASPASARRCAMAGLAGFVIVWFSQAAMLVMGGLGLVLVGCWLLGRDRSARLPTLITVPVWAVSALIGLWVARHHTTPQVLAYMHQFWKQRLGFFPLPPRHARDTLWLWDQVRLLFEEDTMLKYPVPWLYEAIAILGIVALWRRRRDLALIVSAPLIVAVAAAVVQQYPFRFRVALFVTPSLLLLAAAGIGWLVAQAARLYPPMGLAALAALVAPPVYATLADPPPYVIENYKSVLAHVQAHRRRDDLVYVYPFAYEAMAHYGPRYGLGPGGYILGTCDEHESPALPRGRRPASRVATSLGHPRQHTSILPSSPVDRAVPSRYRGGARFSRHPLASTALPGQRRVIRSERLHSAARHDGGNFPGHGDQRHVAATLQRLGPTHC